MDPAGVAHLFSLPGFRLRYLVVEPIVAVLVQLETQPLAVLFVLHILADVADVGLGLLVDADHLYQFGDRLAAIFDMNHRRDLDRRRHAGNRISHRRADPRHLILRVGHALRTACPDCHVRQNPLDTVLHLGRETVHHTIDHDHRGHAQHHADDRRQCDVASPKITPAEEEFIHGEEEERG